jgi:hypothetical protein
MEQGFQTSAPEELPAALVGATVMATVAEDVAGFRRSLFFFFLRFSRSNGFE